MLAAPGALVRGERVAAAAVAEVEGVVTRRLFLSALAGLAGVGAGAGRFVRGLLGKGAPQFCLTIPSALFAGRPARIVFKRDGDRHSCEITDLATGKALPEPAACEVTLERRDGIGLTASGRAAWRSGASVGAEAKAGSPWLEWTDSSDLA